MASVCFSVFGRLRPNRLFIYIQYLCHIVMKQPRLQVNDLRLQAQEDIYLFIKTTHDTIVTI